MATNNEIGADEFRAALATAAEEILGTQIEPGSLAERLLRQGREEGREEGRMEGRAEGREEGRAEGLRRGELMGRLQLLSELLGEPCSPNLGSMSLDDLRTIEQELQLRLTQRRNRSTE